MDWEKQRGNRGGLWEDERRVWRFLYFVIFFFPTLWFGFGFDGHYMHGYVRGDGDEAEG